MSDAPPFQSEIILCQTEDGRTRIQCRFESETLWLTQAQIAELFQTTTQNVTQHLKAVFAEGELGEESTLKDYLQVRWEHRSCMRWIVEQHSGKRIGQPKIGSGLAGGDWPMLAAIIEEGLAGEDFTVVEFTP